MAALTFAYHHIVKKYWGGLIITPFFLYFLLYYPFSFNIDTYNIKGYYVALPFCVIAALVAIHYCKKTIAVSVWDACLPGVLIIALLLLSFSSYYNLFNEHFFIVITALALYGLIRISDVQGTVHFFFFVFVLLYGIEYIIALLQYNAHSGSGSLHLNISGTIQNSGIFSCYLVISFPVILYITHSIIRRAAIQKIVSLAVLLMTVFMLYHTHSRTAIFTLIAIVPLLLLFYYNTAILSVYRKMSRYKKAGIFIIAALLVGVLAFELFHLKRPSAIGRLLGWHITWQHITDHWWWGTGIGRFTWFYPQWQIQYFAAHAAPASDFYLSAGETYSSFNEYLQLFHELGVVGSGIALLLLYDFFQSRSAAHKALLYCTKCTVLAILLCGLTSYPLHVNIFLMLLAVSFALCHTIRDNPSFSNKQLSPILVARLLRVALPVAVLLAMFTCTRQAIAVQRWQQLVTDNSNSRDKKQQQYAALYPVLHNSGKFLLTYGAFLLENEHNYTKAIRILHESEQYCITPETYTLIGMAYKKMHQYEKAMHYFRLLSLYIPNRFRPKYEMVKLLLRQGNTQQAYAMAQTILTMPVKRPSPEVERIRKEMILLLKKNHTE